MGFHKISENVDSESASDYFFHSAKIQMTLQQLLSNARRMKMPIPTFYPKTKTK